MAPVKDPRSAPNSAAWRSPSGTVAQSKATRAPDRPERGWITSRTRRLLPVPVGPVMSSGMGVGESAATFRRSSRMAALTPQKNRPVRCGAERSSRTRRNSATSPAPVSSSAA